MGLEISLAGGSFLQPSMLGNFRYGSELVNIVGDATIPGSIGSFGFDDDGVPAQRFHLIENGMFVGYLTGRDTAPAIGRKSNGTVRAETAARIPIIRMTNINLEPGTTPLADIIADTKRGIFVETNKSWSIDDLRLNFQFGCEVAYEIENGRLGRLLRNPLYTGHDAGVLALLRRRRRSRELADLGPAELRQRRSDADDARGARRAGEVPGCGDVLRAEGRKRGDGVSSSPALLTTIALRRSRR